MTFGFITIVTVLLLVFWLWESPATPALLRNGVAPQARKTIENYKQLTSTITDNTTKLFDLVVVRAILPVFTAIVGYIFGRSQS